MRTKSFLNDLSDEDLEFLCQDLLREKGFTISHRPARGPDQGKDMIAERHVEDDMEVTWQEKWLIECKNRRGKKASIKEQDLGNIESRMKLHKANRYLLVTTGSVSETIKNHLSAISDDPETTRKATYWAGSDLSRILEKYPHVRDRYLHTWERQAKRAATIIGKHHFEAHRGAIKWRADVVAIFENGTRADFGIYRELLAERDIKELAFTTVNATSVMLVESEDAYAIDDLIWFVQPRGIQWLSERQIARGRIWMFMTDPIQDQDES